MKCCGLMQFYRLNLKRRRAKVAFSEKRRLKMKQGRAASGGSESRKVEPKPHAISPRGVSQYGYATGSRMSSTGHYLTSNSALPVKEGQGFVGPTPPAQGVGPGGGRMVLRSG